MTTFQVIYYMWPKKRTTSSLFLYGHSSTLSDEEAEKAQTAEIHEGR